MGSPFGLGFVGAIPPGANPTPVQLALIRTAKFNYSQELKPLEGGGYGFAKDMAHGKRKVSLEAQYVYWQSVGVAAFLTGSTSATGIKYMAVNEAGTIPSTPFQVTVANSATFETDWGVQNKTTGKQMTNVAAGPATGQYSVAAGVYTFAAADTTNLVQITYSYGNATQGKTISMSNQLMAPATGFIVRGVSASTGAKFAGVHLYNAFVPKLSLTFKAEDWADTDVEFEGIEDPATGKVFDLYAGD
jgi:hypothetical protein